MWGRDREVREDETNKLRRKVAELERELQQCHSVLKAVDEEYSVRLDLERPKAWELVHALYDGSLAHLEQIAAVGRGLRGGEDRWGAGRLIVEVVDEEMRRGPFGQSRASSSSTSTPSTAPTTASRPVNPQRPQDGKARDSASQNALVSRPDGERMERCGYWGGVSSLMGCGKDGPTSRFVAR